LFCRSRFKVPQSSKPVWHFDYSVIEFPFVQFWHLAVVLMVAGFY